MTYVDTYIAAVPAANKDAYIEMSSKMSELFSEYGVNRLVASWGDDVPEGELTSFPRALQRQGDEVVAFSWLLRPSKEVREQGVKKMRSDERMHKMSMPFDGKRIIFGGFKTIVDEQLQAGSISEQRYLDNFIAAVPQANKDAYIKSAHRFMPVFKRHGALHTSEAWGDDVPPGKLTSFPRAVQMQDDENVAVSWVAWPSRAARNACMEQMMNDPEMQNMDMPFDGKRVVYGGFEVIVDSANS